MEEYPFDLHNYGCINLINNDFNKNKDSQRKDSVAYFNKKDQTYCIFHNQSETQQNIELKVNTKKKTLSFLSYYMDKTKSVIITLNANNIDINKKYSLCVSAAFPPFFIHIQDFNIFKGCNMSKSFIM